MGDHVLVTFNDIQPEQSDWVIAHLAEAGYDGFEESEHSLKAYIKKEFFDRAYLKELAFKYQLTYLENLIPEKNWNDIWESSFQPVIVEDFVGVRADFHPPLTGVKQEIIITPKMSFGTGHHATTYLMLQEMQQIDFHGKTVLDFGTGTGVLSILAEKCGASEILALDNDDWSIANAAENISHNNCTRIKLLLSENISRESVFDIILANINRHVLLQNMEVLSKILSARGIVLMSGILTDDRELIQEAAGKYRLKMVGMVEKDNWLCLRFVHDT
jgi:ribosomal protein L11 methyltransferase